MGKSLLDVQRELKIKAAYISPLKILTPLHSKYQDS